MPTPHQLTVPLESGAAVTARIYQAASSAQGALILGHGAGAGQDSPFMKAFARALATLGVETVTFNFLYTEQGRRAPDRQPVLESCYRSVIEQVRQHVPAAQNRLFIGGKSMGGRIATHVATDPEHRLAGLVLLGYPLHPPGRPEQRRDAHLAAVAAPLLFVQGSRDAFGTPAEFEPVLAVLGNRATFHVVEGGDHSFKVTKSAPQAQGAVHEEIQRTIADWMTRVGSAAG